VAVQAGGHTPGSSLFVARVGDTTWVFAGDVANFRSALLANEPKPAVYSLLITPEAPQVLERLRTGLAALDAAPDFSVVVSHDGGALE
jgi:glyoxylase-like metal-dependent hydrolase (beta-lactamase superfamily II)